MEAKEEKTEISCMLSMQDQVDDLVASGVTLKECPFDEMVTAAVVEQPPCAEYLHDIALFVKECGWEKASILATPLLSTSKIEQWNA